MATENTNKLALWAGALGCTFLIACGSESEVGFTETGTKNPAEEDPNILVNVTNNDPELFEPANIIADFEDIPFMQNPANGWTLTGVFAEENDWRGISSSESAARVGSAAVSTCEIGGSDCDSNTGSILTPPFSISSNYINFLMTGGATDVGVELRLAGTENALLSYQPDSCGKPTISDNDDWFNMDVRALRGQEVQLYLFDNESGGCGFISFDHFYQSASAIGDQVASAGSPITAVNASFPDDALSGIISTFDDAVQMARSEEFGGEGWFADGDFFNPRSDDSWEGSSAAPGAARIGARAFSSCSTLASGCESLVGSITSSPFEIEKDYLRFMAAGGSAENGEVAIRVLRASTDEVLASFTPETCDSKFIAGDDDWYQFDVSRIVGQSVKLQIVDNSTEPCGYISVDHAYQTDAQSFIDRDGDELTPGSAGEADIPTELKAFNVDVAADAFIEENVVATFDNPQEMIDNGWISTGDFANPESATAWQGATRFSASAKVGLEAVSTCEINDNAKGCDEPMGTLTSPPTRVTAPYLYFLMAGGNGDVPVGLRILDSLGNELHNYSPNSCGPAYIDGNDDWTIITQESISNAVVHYQLYDEESGGCGFVSFDHMYQSERDPDEDDGILPVDLVNGGLVMLSDEQLESVGFNSTLPYADSNEMVIGRFDDAQQTLADGWIASGDFQNPADGAAWQGTTRLEASAKIGKGAVSTCELNDNASGCDAPTGTLTSPQVTVIEEKPLLVFMMAGGNGSAPVGLRVLDASDDSEIANFTPNSCGPSHIAGDDDWQEIDLSEEVGTEIKIEIYDHEMGGCGFLSFDHVHMSNGEPVVFD